MGGSAARAATVTLDVTGTIADIYEYDHGLVDSSLSVGTAFQLHAVYDDAAEPLGYPTSPGTTEFNLPVPPSELTLTVGSYSATPGAYGLNITVGDGPGGSDDNFWIASDGNVASSLGPMQAQFGLYLGDSSGTAVTGPAISNVSLALSSWNPYIANNSSGSMVQMFLYSYDPTYREASVRMRIDSIAVTPEPGVAALGALAVALSLALRRRAR